MRARVVAAVAALVAVVAVVTGVSAWLMLRDTPKTVAIPQQLAYEMPITQIEGEGDAFDAFDTFAEMRSFIASNTTNPQNLRTWGLCRSELAAGSLAWQRYAQSYRDYAADLPYNRTTTGDQRYDKQQIAYAMEAATALGKAADLAGAMDLPCVNPDYGISEAGVVVLPYENGGQRFSVNVPATDVLGLIDSIEAMLASGQTECTYGARLEQATALTVSTTVGPRHKTLSERERAYQILVAQTNRDLAADNGISCA